MPSDRGDAGSGGALDRAERALHERSRLACVAAAGVVGDFRVWEAGGVRAVLATEPALAFLSTVVDPATVRTAIELVGWSKADAYD